jgi:hypothetical protein
MAKSKWVIWARDEARTGEKMNAYVYFVRKPEDADRRIIL